MKMKMYARYVDAMMKVVVVCASYSDVVMAALYYD